jgi:hypothetical protein
MPEGSKERRISPRFSMRLPVVARFTNGSVHEEHTFTRDVSASGVFFDVDLDVGGRRELEVILTLPGEGENPANIRVRYSGRVARLERLSEGRWGVAAALSSCEFLHQA